MVKDLIMIVDKFDFMSSSAYLFLSTESGFVYSYDFSSILTNHLPV